MKSKKGTSMTEAPGVVLSIALAILIGGALMLGLTSFRQTNCAGDWNTTREVCYASGTNHSTVLGSYTYNVSNNGQLSLSNWSAQTPTLGTIFGVALIVAVVVGAFAMFGLKGKGAL